MSSEDTRKKLIEIIKHHQLENGLIKLQIGKLSELAGITRQAFNRYYGDLKDYATGQESIGKLLIDDKASLGQLLESNIFRAAQLEQQLADATSKHKYEIDKAIRNHVTALMSNDLMIYESQQIRSTLTAQGNHNVSLIDKINQLQVENTKLVADSASMTDILESSRSSKTIKNFIPIELDMKRATKKYAATSDFNAYEDAKDSEINKSIEFIKCLPDPQSTEIVLFQERYISDFKKFCDKMHPQHGLTMIVMQLPLYSREEIQIVLKALQAVTSVSIYIPHCDSEAVVSAQRKFSQRNVPPEELKDADTAKTPLIDWGFDSVHVIRIKQGD